MRYSIEDTILTDIAKRIRDGKGTTKEEMPLSPEVFAEEIEVYINSLRGVMDKSSATYVIIPHGANKIGRKAFENYSSLKSVTIPNTVTTIDNDAFAGCTSLEGIILPNSITHLGGFVFSGCSSIKYVKMPSGINTITDCAFNNCSACVEYDFSNYTKSTPPALGSNVFQYINANAKIIVPESEYHGWITATNWADLVSNIVSIGQATTGVSIPLKTIWLCGGIHYVVGGNVSLKAYYNINGGSAVEFNYDNPAFGGLVFSQTYDGDTCYSMMENSLITFTEAGTYEIWVENANGNKLYRRILEVS